MTRTDAEFRQAPGVAPRIPSSSAFVRCFRVAVALGLLAFALPLAAQAEPPTLRPGDVAVSGQHLEPYRNAWSFQRRDPSGELQSLGTWTDELRLEGEAGQEVIVRRQEIPRPDGGLQVLINRARRADLVPVSFEISMNGETMNRVEFEASGLRILAPGQSEAISRPLEEPVFDWLLYGILISGFPLDHGYAARFPALDQTLQPTFRQIRVTGRPSIPGPDGDEQAVWRVEGDEGLTFWLAEKAPYILRVEKKNPDGSTLLWQLGASPEKGPVSGAAPEGP